MAVDAKISRALDNNTVQVDITSKKMSPKYYQVPKQKADSFMQEYKKNERKTNVYSNILFGAATLAGVILTNALMRNLTSNKIAQFACSTIGGVIGATGSVFITANQMDKKHNELLKKHQAKQIFFDA